MLWNNSMCENLIFGEMKRIETMTAWIKNEDEAGGCLDIITEWKGGRESANLFCILCSSEVVSVISGTYIMEYYNDFQPDTHADQDQDGEQQFQYDFPTQVSVFVQ